MKIAVYGAGGRIGQRITTEALSRGHEVTALVRDPAQVTLTHPQLTMVQGNALDADGISAQVAGHDAVVSAMGANRQAGNYHILVDAAHALIDGLTRAGVQRLLIVGGAGSLEVAPGMQLVDSPEFPEAWKPGALAHRDALHVYQKADLDWTYFSPAGLIEPGERTGKYRLGTDQLVTDSDGKSWISMEDYAVALLDELENPQFIRRRYTAAY